MLVIVTVEVVVIDRFAVEVVGEGVIVGLVVDKGVTSNVTVV